MQRYKYVIFQPLIDGPLIIIRKGWTILLTSCSKWSSWLWRLTSTLSGTWGIVVIFSKEMKCLVRHCKFKCKLKILAKFYHNFFIYFTFFVKYFKYSLCQLSPRDSIFNYYIFVDYFYTVLVYQCLILNLTLKDIFLHYNWWN